MEIVTRVITGLYGSLLNPLSSFGLGVLITIRMVQDRNLSGLGCLAQVSLIMLTVGITAGWSRGKKD